MAIPTTSELIEPLLKLLRDGRVISLKSCVSQLALLLDLSESDKNILQPSGRQSKFEKRVGWAKYYLNHAGLIVTPDRGHFQITDFGRRILNNHQGEIKIKDLLKLAEEKYR